MMNVDDNTFQECLTIYGATGGIAGPQGGIGFQGTQGIEGNGIVGAQGNVGPQGTQGFVGLQGTQGDIGIGQAGVQGNQGSQGVVGIGTQGLQGDVGVQGDVGSNGNIGFQGNVGVQGSQGFASATFTYGSNVVTFTNGLSTVSHNLGSVPTTVLLTNGDVQAGEQPMGVYSLSSTVINVSIPGLVNGNRRVNWMAIK